MGWTYHEYVSQPTFFIDALKDALVKEQKAQLAAMKKAKAQSKRR